jgi:pre-rRNA-processing protein TSR2
MVHPNQAAFTEGLNYVLRSWSALKLAVEQDWGGPDSEEKRDWMAETLVEYFGASMCLHSTCRNFTCNYTLLLT